MCLHRLPLLFPVRPNPMDPVPMTDRVVVFRHPRLVLKFPVRLNLDDLLPVPVDLPCPGSNEK